MSNGYPFFALTALALLFSPGIQHPIPTNDYTYSRQMGTYRTPPYTPPNVRANPKVPPRSRSNHMTILGKTK
jgi:hypothetical protein